MKYVVASILLAVHGLVVAQTVPATLSRVAHGKTPITRCENVAKYQTIEAIDQPGVHVVVNPAAVISALLAPS